MKSSLATEPVWSALLSAVLFRDGWLEAGGRLNIRLGKFPGTKIETEVGFIIGEAIFGGLESAIHGMRSLMDKARATAGDAKHV